MNFNYQKICQDLLKDLPERQKEVILRRFGLETGQRETLEYIGKSHQITRERVRQIEGDGLEKLKPKLGKYQKTFQYFEDLLKTTGNLRKEDTLIRSLAGSSKFQGHILFLLNLGENFERFSETRDFHSLWTINPESLNLAQKVIDSFYNKLREINQPLTLQDYNPPVHLASQALLSYLEISKIIQKTPEGFFGLRDWPEINPRGIKDRAYLVLKKIKAPLHFTEVAKLIDKSALPQTVHNELIRDSRFVLVGRGLYALAEWGYEPGRVKDVIFRVLKESKKPLSKEEILEKILKQRIVKENTVLLNLSNKKYFLKNSQGQYTIKEV